MQGLCKNMRGYQYQAMKVMLNSYIDSLLMHCRNVYYNRQKVKYRRMIDQPIICWGYKDISGESAGLLVAEEPLTVRIMVHTGRPVPYWVILPTLRKNCNGNTIALSEARKQWETDTLRKWEEWAGHRLSHWTHSL